MYFNLGMNGFFHPKLDRKMEQTRQQETNVQAYRSPKCVIVRYSDTDVIRTSDIPVKWGWEWDSESESDGIFE